MIISINVRVGHMGGVSLGLGYETVWMHSIFKGMFILIKETTLKDHPVPECSMGSAETFAVIAPQSLSLCPTWLSFLPWTLKSPNYRHRIIGKE